MTYYNSLRGNWTFPYKAGEIFDALQARLKEAAGQYDEKLTQEEYLDDQLALYRESLRRAGVMGYEHALPPKSSYSREKDTLLAARRKHKEEMDELMLLKSIMQHQCGLDKHRMFKLTPADVKFFGLNTNNEENDDDCSN